MRLNNLWQLLKLRGRGWEGLRVVLLLRDVPDIFLSILIPLILIPVKIIEGNSLLCFGIISRPGQEHLVEAGQWNDCCETQAMSELNAEPLM